MAEHFGAAAEFSNRRFDGILAHTNEVVSVGVAQSQVMGNDPERVSVLLINLSANTIYVGFNEGVGSTNGIILTPLGGSVAYDVTNDYILPTLQVNALATGAGSNLYVLTQRRIQRLPEVA